VNPAVALLAGVIVLNEPLTAWNVGALVLILAGCILATHRPDEAVPTLQSEERVAR
jgi:drug/metabolite transporter (DMT)-like permease